MEQASQMTLDEAVAIFKRELPLWWWSVCECQTSVHGNCGPEPQSGYQTPEDFDIEPFDVEIYKPSGPWGDGVGEDPTPAQLLMAMIEKAKATRATLATKRGLAAEDMPASKRGKRKETP
jgi:hypothetical protein